MKKKLLGLVLGCGILFFSTGCVAEILSLYAISQLPGVADAVGQVVSNVTGQ